MRKIIVLSVLILVLAFSGGCVSRPKTAPTGAPAATSPAAAPTETPVVAVPTLAPPPSALNAKTSFYDDIKIVPAIEGCELNQIDYVKPPLIGQLRSMAALRNYMISASYSKGPQFFSLPIVGLTQDGIAEFNSQVSNQGSWSSQSKMAVLRTPEGHEVPQETPPPPTFSTTTKTIGGVTVYISNSTSYSLMEPSKEIASYSNFEYKWLKDGASYALTGGGYKDSRGEQDPTSELLSMTEKAIRGPRIELKNYGFLGMKEYLPDPSGTWNLYRIEAMKSSPSGGYTSPGAMKVVGTYAKEVSEQYGTNPKDIRVVIDFGSAQMPRELMENSTLVIANKKVVAGYSYSYMYPAVEKRVEEPYVKEQEQPQPVKQRDSYMLVWVDTERYATIYAETKADYKSEYEGTMKQFMTDVLSAVYK